LGRAGTLGAKPGMLAWKTGQRLSQYQEILVMQVAAAI